MKSNFDLETVSDVLIADNVNQHYAKDIQKALNDKFSGHIAPYWFEIFPDEHELYKYEP